MDITPGSLALTIVGAAVSELAVMTLTRLLVPNPNGAALVMIAAFGIPFVAGAIGGAVTARPAARLPLPATLGCLVAGAVIASGIQVILAQSTSAVLLWLVVGLLVWLGSLTTSLPLRAAGRREDDYAY